MPIAAGRRQRVIGRSDSRRPQARRRHGLTARQVDALRERQGGRCAICAAEGGSTPADKLQIDHDHRHCPGSEGCPRCIRGMLCPVCNLRMVYVDRHLPRLLVYLGIAS